MLVRLLRRIGSGARWVPNYESECDKSRQSRAFKASIFLTYYGAFQLRGLANFGGGLRHGYVALFGRKYLWLAGLLKGAEESLECHQCFNASFRHVPYY